MNNFFLGDAAIRLNYVFATDNWLVWMEDQGIKSGLRVYKTYTSAVSDFNYRVRILKGVIAA
jgi:hypothetical protein